MAASDIHTTLARRPHIWPALTLAASAGLLGGAWAFQIFGGLHPCPLCIWQRWPYWIMIGLDTAQIAQSFGVDDLDGTVQEEKIYHMAGADTPQAMTRNQLVRLIREAGRSAVERDTLYNVLWEDDGSPLEGIRLDASVPYSSEANKTRLRVLA